jgi:hypothetical protein
MNRVVERLLFDTYPHRSIARELARRLRLFSYEWRVSKGAVERPHYAYCVYEGARLAKRLGYKRISVIEFGVAGGEGLLSLEYHAEQTSKSLGIEIEVYGFDTAEGLPHPEDYRDLPYHWKKGFYRMDYAELREKLRSAKLIIGDVRDTPERFFNDHHAAPIAAVIHDLDYYSSTAAALRLFGTDDEHLLPRVFNYFDDIVGTNIELYNDYTGERLAIQEFNSQHERRKFSPAYHLLCKEVVEPWHHQIFILHLFEHNRYNDFVSDENQQLSLK